MTWPAPAEVTVVRISTTSGSVHVAAEPGLRDVVARVGSVTTTGSLDVIDAGSDKVRVRVPEGTDVVVGSTSGRVAIEGEVGATSVLTTSGRISIARARSVDARSVSGRVQIGHVEESCRVVATSGRVEIDRCGDADVTSGSGRIVLRDAHGPVRAHCSSGRIEVGMAAAHDVDAETVSGRITVSLPAGSTPLVVASAAHAPMDRGEHDCVVVVRSGSGRVVVGNR